MNEQRVAPIGAAGTTGSEEEREGRLWQARAQINLGILIERYLRENPPPALAPHAHLLRNWGRDLQAAGEARLEELGAPRLHVV